MPSRQRAPPTPRAPPVPAGRPEAASAGSRACSTIACAVPSASEPIRNTTVLPGADDTCRVGEHVRVGPSNTNPTTPSGARRASSVQPSCSITRARRRHARRGRRPAAKSVDHVGAHRVADSTRRVVDRPRPAARADVGLVGRSRSARTCVVGQPVGERVEERGDLLVGTAGEPANASRARSTAATARSYSADGTCSRSPLSGSTTAGRRQRRPLPDSVDTCVTRLPPNTIG